MMLSLAITCWILGVWAMLDSGNGPEFWGWMLAAMLFALSAS